MDPDEGSETVVGIEACGLEEDAVDGRAVVIGVVGITVETARLVLSVWLGTVTLYPSQDFSDEGKGWKQVHPQICPRKGQGVDPPHFPVQ